MKQTDSNATRVKRSVDIEKLLVWAIRDELPKKQLSAAEGIWDRIEDYGQRGGIDPGHGAAQRYAHFGLPHPDAEVVGQAINRLKDDVIDWGKSIGALAGDLAGLVTINDLERNPPSQFLACIAKSPIEDFDDVNTSMIWEPC